MAIRPAHSFLRAVQLYDFLTLYVLAGLWMLLALPQKPANRILEILFPIIRHYYFRKERETGPRLYASEH